MASSDSDASETRETIPSDARIEKRLRSVAASIFRSDLNKLTVKQVREATEHALKLPNNFLKTDEKWNTKSKTIIKDEVANQESILSSLPPSSPEQERVLPKAISPTKVKAAPKPTSNTTHIDDDESPAKKPTKRKSTEPAPAPAPVPKKKRRTIESSPVPESEPLQAAEDEDDVDAETTNQEGANGDKTPHGDSDLSSLEDDDPPPRKSRKKRSSSPSRSSPKPKAAKSEAKSKTTTEPSPNDLLIKTLQNQLVKCGVRKVWGAYLKSYETPKQKIAHLKSLLEDVGMTGRFSEEKARQIKDERELKADLDDVVVMEKKWGREKEQPRKRAKALEGLEGLIDDEESD